MLRVTLFEFFPRSLASENLSPWAIVWHCFHNSTFNHFDTLLACDLQTDRSTDRQTDRHMMMSSTALA